jgi:uncharacterized membrane protein
MLQWIIRRTKILHNSISFYPAVIVLAFLALSVFMINFDYSETGKQLKSDISWLKLRDASTARSIVSVIASGIISLTVFSFSMVMIVLNQAASQMSNRVLDKLIGNRYQQVILGFYIGTIVYSFFLLTAIRDIDDGIYVPALSTYLLILFSICAIFLFIYFLHYITQSIKYATIINRIYKQTKKKLESSCKLKDVPQIVAQKEGTVILSHKSGVFEGFNKKELLEIAKDEDINLSFFYSSGTFILKDAPLLSVTSQKEIKNKVIEKIQVLLFINYDQSIDNNFNFGFRQLVEVAVKALSPGINDPGTAIDSLRSLTRLLSFRLLNYPDNVIKDKNGKERIITVEKSFEEIFQTSFPPIWDYGKDDRLIQQEMVHLLLQLQSQKQDPNINIFLAKLKAHISQTA